MFGVVTRNGNRTPIDERHTQTTDAHIHPPTTRTIHATHTPRAVCLFTVVTFGNRRSRYSYKSRARLKLKLKTPFEFDSKA